MIEFDRVWVGFGLVGECVGVVDDLNDVFGFYRCFFKKKGWVFVGDWSVEGIFVVMLCRLVVFEGYV